MCRRSNRSTFDEKLADGADEFVRIRHDRRVTSVMEGMHTRLRIDITCLGPNGRAVCLILVGFQDENLARPGSQVSTAEMVMCGKVVDLFGYADQVGFAELLS